MPRIIFKELDKTRLHYEAALKRVGKNEAKRAFTRALNSEGRKMRTQVKRALNRQTGIKMGMISAGITTRPASTATLTFRVIGTGKETPLSLFNPTVAGSRTTGRGKASKKVGGGIKASPWRVRRLFAGAFFPGKAGGNVFHRLGSTRYPIEPMYGPSIAKELVKDQSRAVWERAQPAVLAEATRQIARMLVV